MHGLTDQAEFEHRAIVLDETCVRRAASGRELWRVPVTSSIALETSSITAGSATNELAFDGPVDVPPDRPAAAAARFSISILSEAWL